MALPELTQLPSSQVPKRTPGTTPADDSPGVLGSDVLQLTAEVQNLMTQVRLVLAVLVSRALARFSGMPASGTLATAGAGIDVTGDVISAKVATPSGTTLVFTQDAEYGAISSGTFTVDVTGARVGSVVRVRLAAGTTAPSLPSGFTKLAGSFEATKLNVYSFCVCADGTIDYYITTL